MRSSASEGVDGLRCRRPRRARLRPRLRRLRARASPAAPALCEPGAAANAAGTLLSGENRLHARRREPIHHHLGVSAFADHIVVSAALGGAGSTRAAVRARRPVRLRRADRRRRRRQRRPRSSRATASPSSASAASACRRCSVPSSRGRHTIVAVDVMPDKLELAPRAGRHPHRRRGPRRRRRDPRGDRRRRRARDRDGRQRGGARRGLRGHAARRDHRHRRAAPTRAQLLSIPAVRLVAEERTLRGSYLGSCVPARDIPALHRAPAGGRLPVDRLLTHRFALDEINEGFDRLPAARPCARPSSSSRPLRQAVRRRPTRDRTAGPAPPPRLCLDLFRCLSYSFDTETFSPQLSQGAPWQKQSAPRSNPTSGASRSSSFSARSVGARHDDRQRRARHARPRPQRPLDTIQWVASAYLPSLAARDPDHRLGRPPLRRPPGLPHRPRSSSPPGPPYAVWLGCPDSLIFFRVLQGIGAACLMPDWPDERSSKAAGPREPGRA